MYFEALMYLAYSFFARLIRMIIIAVSYTTYRFLVEKFRFPRRRIFVVYNILESCQVSDMCRKLDIGVFISRASRYKQYEHAILATKLVYVKVPNFRLYLVGECAEAPIVHKLVAKHGLRGIVIPLGYVRDQILEKLLQGAKVNIVTSLKEGFGRTIIESAKYGVVTVAYDVVGVSEAVKMLGGVLVRQDSPRQLAKAIVQVFENYDKYSQCVLSKFRQYTVLAEACLEKAVQFLARLLPS